MYLRHGGAFLSNYAPEFSRDLRHNETHTMLMRNSSYRDSTNIVAFHETDPTLLRLLRTPDDLLISICTSLDEVFDQCQSITEVCKDIYGKFDSPAKILIFRFFVRFELHKSYPRVIVPLLRRLGNLSQESRLQDSWCSVRQR